MKRTKIICTIGPASGKQSTLVSMIRSGMNVARLNLSHGTHGSHTKLFRMIRSAAAEAKEPVAVLADLQGPKIRLGNLPEEGIDLKKGATVRLPVTYRNLYRDVKKGDRIMIDDGLIEATYLSGRPGIAVMKVVSGGRVTSHKGMNFPDSTLHVSPITAKDKDDVAFAAGLGVEWVALSFVTRPEDIVALRRLIKRAGKRGQTLPRIIVKIEKHEAIDRFDAILAVADAVMVARGDLGVEIPAEEVPVRQKEIVEKCRKAGKPVVVATQMLDSMIRNPRPTRAEVSDVANAVFDHTDAVMLSGESATGKYPLQAVKAMAAIVARAEASPYDDISGGSFAEVDAILASLILAPWSDTIMRTHPEIPCFLAAPNETEARQENIRWGIRPFLLKNAKPGTFVRHAEAELKKRKWITSGMRVAVAMDADTRTALPVFIIEK